MEPVDSNPVESKANSEPNRFGRVRAFTNRVTLPFHSSCSFADSAFLPSRSSAVISSGTNASFIVGTELADQPRGLSVCIGTVQYATDVLYANIKYSFALAKWTMLGYDLAILYIRKYISMMCG